MLPKSTRRAYRSGAQPSSRFTGALLLSSVHTCHCDSSIIKLSCATEETWRAGVWLWENSTLTFISLYSLVSCWSFQTQAGVPQCEELPRTGRNVLWPSFVVNYSRMSSDNSPVMMGAFQQHEILLCGGAVARLDGPSLLP